MDVVCWATGGGRDSVFGLGSRVVYDVKHIVKVE